MYIDPSGELFGEWQWLLCAINPLSTKKIEMQPSWEFVFKDELASDTLILFLFEKEELEETSW